MIRDECKKRLMLQLGALWALIVCLICYGEYQFHLSRYEHNETRQQFIDRRKWFDASTKFQAQTNKALMEAWKILQTENPDLKLKVPQLKAPPKPPPLPESYTRIR